MKFEPVKRFEKEDIMMPMRQTKYSAGYDMFVAEETVIPSYLNLMKLLEENSSPDAYTLEDMASLTKQLGIQPTLVSTGVKCKLDDDMYLKLVVRSSTPKKYWIICGNSIGVIDADYYNNKSNEGEIFFQLINLSPYPIVLHKGDCIGQGIICKYYTVDDDNTDRVRIGGFGSTSEGAEP